MIEILDVPVSVWVEYDHETRCMTILNVMLDGRLHTIQKLGHRYTEREGRVLFHVFCVATPTLALKLRLNTTSMQWRCLERRIHGLD